ncbi:MAG: hypothetical protein Ct9H300mP28_00770 [Pseudomonadota bacterium]|nr:MAG: hypothetical protein Ct9H300mP28_00770 [Pseudomonadota bacterium]
MVQALPEKWIHGCYLFIFFREDLQMTGTHIGCDTTHCGACTVFMDGRSIKACTVYRYRLRQIIDYH